MKNLISMTSVAAVTAMFALSACSTQEEMASKPAPKPAATAKAPAPAKAKVEKARGDVGLLDTEKNYLILVTKEGMADIGLGSSATVIYTKANDKNIASKVEYRVKKGGE